MKGAQPATAECTTTASETLTRVCLLPRSRRTAEEIEEHLTQQRAALAAEAERQELALQPKETHALAARKEEEMVGLRAAFGLKDVAEGEAFDRELQERKKLVRPEYP